MPLKMEKPISEKQYIQIVRGHPFPKAPIYQKQKIEEAFDYTPLDDDIVITSYPKTGTTWLQYIVMQIVSKGLHFPTKDHVLPRLEIAGAARVDALSHPRIYTHHLPYNMAQKNSKAKVLYIYRRPEDTMVSYYHFLRNLRSEDLDQEDFFEDFVAGNVGYGSYLEHVSSYFAHEGDENLLFVSYEDLHENRRQGIRRIAKFLGDEYMDGLEDTVLEKIVLQTSFDFMKSRLSWSVQTDANKEGRKKIEFFRKGIVGDGKNFLSEQQLKKLRSEVIAVLHDASVAKEWLE